VSSTTAPGTKAPARGARSREAEGRLHSWLERLDTPVTTYYAILAVTVALLAFGLVMVLSASAIDSLKGSNSPYSIFISQLVYAGLGGLVLFAASRISVQWWRLLAYPILGLAGLLQVGVLLFGISVMGNRNWIQLGPVRAQPSELLKVGLVLTGAVALGAAGKKLTSFSHVLLPYIFPIATVSIGLVLGGHDLGTVLILGAIVVTVLFVAGVPGKWFVGAFGAFGALAVVMVLTSANRLGRFDVWLGRDTDPFGAARQPIHGRYALADGGWLGLGLGASREKWGGLAEAHNDFIFAIIGEELGLPGTLVVLLLFVVLALAAYRLVLRSSDFFVRVATAGILAWIISQAIINIGSVIGMLPVIGVPLPLVSSGGSSLITTMLGLGILLSFARAEPGCAEALKGRSSLLRRSAAVIPTPRLRRRDASRGSQR
jgi:cell division protein FtsW